MSGVSCWRTHASSQVLKSLSILQRSNSFSLVPQSDPGKFLVKSNFKTFRLCIGNPHTCACKKEQPCIHVLFVLTHHHQVSFTSDLLFQEGLSEVILMSLLREVEPQLKDSSSCFFCKDQKNVVGCEYCEQKFHKVCLELAAKMRKSVVTCPKCKSQIKEGDHWLENTCNHCKSVLEKTYYRCLFCLTQNYSLCYRCYQSKKIHTFHPFVFESSYFQSSNNSESCRNEIALMQYREITPEDYQALLLLDDGRRTFPLKMDQFRNLEKRLCNSLEADSSCPICLERFSEATECVVLPCGHVLHFECGQNWLTTYKNECPVDHTKVICTDTR